MKKKFRYTKFIFNLLVVLSIIGTVILGGYFLLDKAVVPKYFSEYGINSMNDLVGMMQTLYSLPSESQIVTNGYNPSDRSIATKTLVKAGYPVFEDGTFDFVSFEEGKKGVGDIQLTDRELASVLDNLLDSTEFSDILPNLNNIDTINMNLIELTITPDVLEDLTSSKNSAHIKFILKVDTSEVRTQMASSMNIPIFLLNMIFPKTLYLTANYNVYIDNSAATSVWQTSKGGLSVNGSTERQSEILLNLLISFLFNEDEAMTIEKLVDNFGHILDQGVELFGEVEFVSKIGTAKSQNGIYFLPVEVVETEAQI